MTDTINLDALSVQWFNVEKILDGETHRWKLNDRVSTGVSIWMAAIAPLFEEIEKARLQGTAMQILTAQRELEERTLYLCLEVFRNGYPDMNEDFIRSHFTHDERWDIVQHFFTIRGVTSLSVPDGGEATETATPVVASVETVEHTPTPSASTAKKIRHTRNPELELVERLSD